MKITGRLHISEMFFDIKGVQYVGQGKVSKETFRRNILDQLLIQPAIDLFRLSLFVELFYFTGIKRNRICDTIRFEGFDIAKGPETAMFRAFDLRGIKALIDSEINTILLFGFLQEISHR